MFIPNNLQKCRNCRKSDMSQSLGRRSEFLMNILVKDSQILRKKCNYGRDGVRSAGTKITHSRQHARSDFQVAIVLENFEQCRKGKRIWGSADCKDCRSAYDGRLIL